MWAGRRTRGWRSWRHLDIHFVMDPLDIEQIIVVNLRFTVVIACQQLLHLVVIDVLNDLSEVHDCLAG